MAGNVWNTEFLDFTAKELANSDLLDSVIYDCSEACMFSENICSELLSCNSTLINKARNLVLLIQKSIESGAVKRDKVSEIFYKNGFSEVASKFEPQLAAYYSTRDTSCDFNGDVQILPHSHSSASLTNLPLCPGSLPDASRSYPSALNELIRQPFDIQVTPARYIYGEEPYTEIYKNDSLPRGYLFMVNNSKFENDVYKPRNGSHVDAANLRNLFTQMGYFVLEYNNLKYRELKKALTSFTEDPHLAHVDSCVVAIMSHGINDSIIMSDNKKVEWTDIRDYFSNGNCPYLRGKPKIFIFQCCRGITPDIGVEVSPSPMFVSNDRMDSEPKSIESTDGDAFGFTMPLTRHNSFSDMYCVFATIEGYVAYLNSERGSWLVEAICLEFMEHAHNTEWKQLMNRVCRRLCKFHSNDGRKQTPDRRNYLFLKDFYFNPQPLPESSIASLHDLKQALPSNTPSKGPVPLTPTGFETNPKDIQKFAFSNPKFESFSCTKDDFKRREMGLDQRQMDTDKDFESFRSEGLDVVDILRKTPPVSPRLRTPGTAEDFHRWRLSQVSNVRSCQQDLDSSACSLKRQLSIPSESEAMKKLHGITDYLKVNELDEFVPMLGPIRDVIMKNKNKHKKKKPENGSSSLDF